ncbi:hypothetical protein TR2A62_1585 [Thalassobium sp. R2A62]|nr:hypothetical protein TR2A62_1585 [Thalassobium sp. R2A62]
MGVVTNSTKMFKVALSLGGWVEGGNLPALDQIRQFQT